MIEAVTFDVGGTLIEPYPSVGEVYAEVARDFGIVCCPATLTRQFREAWSTRSNFQYTLREWYEVVQDSFRGQCDVSEELFEGAYQRFTLAASWRVFDDALPAIHDLRHRGVRLGIISNWDDRLEPLLESLGLRPYFEQVTVSGKAGWHKPDREIFEHTARALSLPTGRILHVGDHAREDVEGARGAGMHAVRIRRDGAEGPYEIPRLTRLGSLLDAIAGGAHH